MKPSVDRISNYATLLGLTEIGLGSILHALKVPLTGTFLCCNQIFLLSRASLEGSNRLETGTISFIAALLKSLAPIGKKITPMIALFLQGAFFNCAILILGNNSLGRMVGGFLAVLSSICQPLLFYYFLYGQLFIETLITGLQALSKEIYLSDNSLLYAYALYTGIKLFLGTASAYAASRLSEEVVAHYFNKITTRVHSSVRFKYNPLKGAFKDVIKPFFVLSALATGLFLFWKENNYTHLLQHFMRTFGLGFLCFYLIRSLPLDRISKRMIQWGSPTFHSSWEKTLIQIQEPLQSLRHESIQEHNGSHSDRT